MSFYYYYIQERLQIPEEFPIRLKGFMDYFHKEITGEIFSITLFKDGYKVDKIKMALLLIGIKDGLILTCTLDHKFFTSIKCNV